MTFLFSIFFSILPVTAVFFRSYQRLRESCAFSI
jgi:hypothetical protein